MIDIIIPSCDKYINITKATIYSIDTFWVNRPKIIILGYKIPSYELPSNCEFISLGIDKTPEKWTSGLRNFFTDYDKEHFILHMDDHCIVKNVDYNKINYLCDKITNDKTIDKIMLTHFMCDGVKLIENDKINIFTYPQNGRYRTSLMNAIWKIDYFKTFLDADLTPWSFEKQKNEGRYDGANILTTDDKLIMINSLMSGGNNINPNWYDSISTKYGFNPPKEDFKNKINKILYEYAEK